MQSFFVQALNLLKIKMHLKFSMLRKHHSGTKRGWIVISLVQYLKQSVTLKFKSNNLNTIYKKFHVCSCPITWKFKQRWSFVNVYLQGLQKFYYFSTKEWTINKKYE